MKLLQPAEYQPLAHAAFTEITTELFPVLLDAQFEHIGASSIPEAISKGDLDICIIVSSEAHPTTVGTLENMGYSIKTDTFRNPELCMLLSPRKDIDVALQVVAKDSQFEFFMRFRDILRANPALVKEYNQIKHDYVILGEQKYRDKKTEFIELVLASKYT